MLHSYVNEAAVMHPGNAESFYYSYMNWLYRHPSDGNLFVRIGNSMCGLQLPSSKTVHN